MRFWAKITKILHLRKRTKPPINLDIELYQQLAPFRLPIIITILMMMIGTLGYIIIDNFSLMDAIYQTGITFTTVGFGEQGELSNAGKLFTIALIILGFGAFSFSIGILVDVLNRGDLSRLLRERSMLYKVARLKNHFVICHHNHYTIQLTQQFRENHIPFVVVDPSENLESEAKKYNYPYYIQEEPHTEVALIKTFLSSAKGIITLSENIADNIALIASARLYEKEIKRKRAYIIITNASTKSDIEKLKKLGADSVISPTKLMAQRISAISQRPEMENILEEFLYKKDTPLDIEEVKVPSYSWLIFKKLKLAKLKESVNVDIIGLRDAKGKFLPMPDKDTIIVQDSKLLLIGASANIKSAKKIIRKKEMPKELQYV